MLKWHHHVASERIQDFLEVFFMIFFQLNKKWGMSGEEEKESIIRVRLE